MLPSQKNPLEYFRAFRNELSAKAGINNFDTDSKAGALVGPLVDELLRSREELTSTFYSNQIQNAVGKELDSIGARYGVSRFQSTFSNVDSSEQCLALYTASTFGAINGGNNIVIPAGSLTISSDPNGNELGATIQYKNTEQITLLAADTIAFISAKAVTIGSGFNVGSKVLKRHNFTGYVDSVAGSLKVVNFYSILNGRDEESNNVYRFRITQQFSKIAQANDTRMLLEALEIPGVINTLTIPGYYGIGTAGVVVLGPENESNTRLVNRVQDRVNSHKTPGHYIQAVPAVRVLFDFELTLKLASSTTVSQQNNIRSQVSRILLKSLKSVGLGGSISLSTLSLDISKQLGNLASVKVVDSPFDKVWVNKSYSGGAFNDRQRLLTDAYALELDEYSDLGTVVINFI